jgi:hypothetical protein
MIFSEAIGRRFWQAAPCRFGVNEFATELHLFYR